MVDRLVEKCCENYNVHAENQWKSMVAEMFEGPTFFFLELQKSKNNKKNRADISSVFFCFFWIRRSRFTQNQFEGKRRMHAPPKKRKGMPGLMVTAERTERCLTETRKTWLELIDRVFFIQLCVLLLLFFKNTHFNNSVRKKTPKQQLIKSEQKPINSSNLKKNKQTPISKTHIFWCFRFQLSCC